jgi:hypothetical protein
MAEITNVSPHEILFDGGTTIIITGSGFTGAFREQWNRKLASGFDQGFPNPFSIEQVAV